MHTCTCIHPCTHPLLFGSHLGLWTTQFIQLVTITKDGNLFGFSLDGYGQSQLHHYGLCTHKANPRRHANCTKLNLAPPCSCIDRKQIGVVISHCHPLLKHCQGCYIATVDGKDVRFSPVTVREPENLCGQQHIAYPSSHSRPSAYFCPMHIFKGVEAALRRAPGNQVQLGLVQSKHCTLPQERPTPVCASFLLLCC